MSYLIITVVAHKKIDDKLIEIMLYGNLVVVEGADVLNDNGNEKLVIDILKCGMNKRG